MTTKLAAAVDDTSTWLVYVAGFPADQGPGEPAMA